MNHRLGALLRKSVKWGGIAALLAGAIVGCVQLRDLATPPEPPGVGPEWKALLADIRAFERKLGYRETKNFASVTQERETFPFCGQSSKFYLPYSYEDPAVRWYDSMDEAQCREAEGDNDVYFGAVEALGEIGTPVTPAMISSRIDRFVYLVIHEDCHDQFDLPYGVEEALCNVITYRAMEVFAAEKFRWFSRERRSINNYAATQSKQTRLTIAHYERLEGIYAQFRRKEISADTLLKERGAVFARAEVDLELPKGEMNNLVLASYMTYSRHYPYLEQVFDRFGRDFARAVAFFQEVDKRKPTPEQVMKARKIADRKSADFIQAYEAAVIDTVRVVLAEKKP